jgi:hypothetical protein
MLADELVSALEAQSLGKLNALAPARRLGVSDEQFRSLLESTRLGSDSRNSQHP